MLREKLMTLRLLLRRLLRSRKKLRLARQRRLKELWLMPMKSMPSESKPWPSVFALCPLPLKVSTFAFVF
jgi:hypothetical protein